MLFNNNVKSTIWHLSLEKINSNLFDDLNIIMYNINTKKEY